TFDFNSVNSVEMLGLNLRKGMTRSDLNVNQAIALTRALVNKSLPVTFNVNLDVTNPNSSPASMTKMDYILTLNDKRVIATTLDQTISVPANASNTVTIPVSTDLFQLFGGESADAIVNLAFKLAGASSDPVNVGIKIKPYITVGGQQLAYPDYITLNKVLQ
ncbi:MAG: LEA type 2 family protein, partial [Bacteroidales bacterium]|nr:LEA type 2 family protein [Bacteroidales bacterium]